MRNKSAFWPQAALIRVTEDRSVGSVRSTGHPELHTREKNTHGRVCVGRYRSSLVSTPQLRVAPRHIQRAGKLISIRRVWLVERKNVMTTPPPSQALCSEDNYVIFTICVDLTADLLYLFILKIKVHLFSLCCGSVIYLKQLVQNYNMKKLIIMDIFNVLSPLSLRSLRNDDALSFLTNILAPLKVCRIIYSQFLFVMNQLKYRQLSLSYYDTWWKLKNNGILRQVLPIYKKICMTFCMLPIRQHMIITYIHPWIYLYIGL